MTRFDPSQALVFVNLYAKSGNWNDLSASVIAFVLAFVRDDLGFVKELRRQHERNSIGDPLAA
jgi:hypothetical protein